MVFEENETRNRKLKILYLSNDLDYFVAHRLILVKAALKHGWSVTICAGNYENNLDCPELQGCDVIPMEVERHRFSFVDDANMIRQYISLIRNIRPDIVQAITIKPNLYGGLAMIWLKLTRMRQPPKFVMLFAGLGKVFEPETNFLHVMRAKFVQTIFKITGKIVRPKLIFENAHDMACMIEKGVASKQNAHVVHGAGIDLSVYHLGEQITKEPMILFASRMIGEKGISDFIAAAKITAKKFPSAKFIAAGAIDHSNPDVFDIAKLSKMELGPVEYVGNLNETELVDVLRKSVAVCLPSKLNEGFPRILLEAAFCKTALITTDQPSVRAIAIPNQTGWLLKRHGGDMSEELSKVMSDALSEMQRTVTMGENANRIALEMGIDADRVSERIFSIYDD